MEHEHGIPIWFFIGILLTVYGVLIFGTGVYGWVNPPPISDRVKLWELHADVWWGVVLTAIGLFYSLRFRPSKHDTLTGA